MAVGVGYRWLGCDVFGVGWARGNKLALRLACTSHFVVGVAVGMAMGLVTGDWLVMIGVTVTGHIYLRCGWGWMGVGMSAHVGHLQVHTQMEHGACK